MMAGHSLLRLAALLLLVWVGALAGAAPEAVQERFQEGNELFQQQKFEEAAAVYDGLLAEGYRTATILYNLGTAEARAGDFASAYGHLRAAHRLAPRHEAISANLEQVESSLFPDERNRPAKSIWRTAATFLTASEWVGLAFGLLMVAALAYAAGAVSGRGEAAALLKGTAWTCVAGLVLLTPLAATSIYYNWVLREAVLVQSAQVRSGPEERFAAIETLPAGTTVRVLEDQDQGYQSVKTTSGRIGYLPASALEMI